MLERNTHIRKWAYVLLSAIIYLYIVQVSRTASLQLQGGWALLFLLYVAINWKQDWTLGKLLLVGGVLRCICCTTLPTLSDDFYRFFWDGLLVQEGIHPGLQAPIAHHNNTLTEAQLQLRNMMNSATYLSPYPPLHQGITYLSTLHYTGICTAIFRMRMLLLTADIGVCLMLATCLRQVGLPAGRAGWYFLHPAAVLEGVGNVHVELVVLLFLLLTCWALHKKYWGGAGAMLALAVSTKLLPFLLLPYLLFRLYYQRGLRSCLSFLASFLCVLAICFAPFFHTDALTAVSSLAYYFSSFAFNAGVYFALRTVFDHIPWHQAIDWLRLGLVVITITGLFVGSYWAARRPNISIAAVMLGLFTWYFAWATTVHPWYLLPLIGLGTLAGRSYAICWSYLAFWSYVGYTSVGYTHAYGWIAASYGCLLLWGYVEWKRKYTFFHI